MTGHSHREIPLATLIAYCRTTYVVTASAREFPLQVGRCHPEFDSWLSTEDAVRWAFLTAFNPRSVERPVAENWTRLKLMESELRMAGYRMFPGEGRGDSTVWPPEPSVLVLNLGEMEAIDFGWRFQQWAFVVGTAGGCAELLFPFPDESASALADALTSADPVVNWTARRAADRRSTDG